MKAKVKVGISLLAAALTFGCADRENKVPAPVLTGQDPVAGCTGDNLKICDYVHDTRAYRMRLVIPTTSKVTIGFYFCDADGCVGEANQTPEFSINCDAGACFPGFAGVGISKSDTDAGRTLHLTYFGNENLPVLASGEEYRVEMLDESGTRTELVSPRQILPNL